MPTRVVEKFLIPDKMKKSKKALYKSLKKSLELNQNVPQHDII